MSSDWLHRLGRDPERLAAGVRARVPAACRRASRQHAPPRGFHAAALHRVFGGSRLDHRAQQSARRADLVVAGRGTARHSRLRAQLCLGEFHPVAEWAVCGRARFDTGLCAVSLPSGRSDAAQARSLAGGSGSLARPCAAGCVHQSGCAAVASGHLRRRASRRAASACRVRPVCHGPLRHIHNRHRCAVPVRL